MKARVNVRYCPTCGGVQQWEEIDPTITATMGGTVVKAPHPLFNNITVTAPQYTMSERYCSCSRDSSVSYGI